MAATYSTSLTTDKDKVRFYVGDTDTTAGVVLLSDEEIGAVLTMADDVDDAVVLCLENLLSRYALTPSTSTLGTSIGAERYEQLKDRQAQWMSRKTRRAIGRGCAITVGGRLLSERDALAMDPDVVQPAFTVNQHDIPNTGVNSDDRDGDYDR